MKFEFTIWPSFTEHQSFLFIHLSLLVRYVELKSVFQVFNILNYLRFSLDPLFNLITFLSENRQVCVGRRTFCFLQLNFFLWFFHFFPFFPPFFFFLFIFCWPTSAVIFQLWCVISSECLKGNRWIFLIISLFLDRRIIQQLLKIASLIYVEPRKIWIVKWSRIYRNIIYARQIDAETPRQFWGWKSGVSFVKESGIFLL